MFDLYKPAGLQEWQTVAWVMYNFAKIGGHLV
jgi:hypothetical protein